MRKIGCLVLLAAGIMLAALYATKPSFATPANAGFKATTLATGTFAEFEVFNQISRQDLPPAFEGNVWLSMQKTKGPSDLYVQSNVWQPGGSTGWHTHPGHSLIIITSGTVTQYGHDCIPRVYGPGTELGTTLIDAGGDHVHLIRNEGSIPATGVAVQLVAQGATRRIDAPAPSGCESVL
jgi:hypothetical protein